MHKAAPEPQRFHPFWVCLVVFLALALDGGIRLYKVVSQRKQIETARSEQEKNSDRLSQIVAQRQQIEPRLQALSMDLLQIAQTNSTARRIVQEFNISWSPPQGQPTSAPASTPSQPAK